MEQGCIQANRIDASGNGYVYLKNTQRTIRASRHIWREVFGPIPSNFVVRHMCDNPACVNHEHLLLGSSKDNSLDMTSRNRQARGEKQGISRLTEEQVVFAMARMLAGEPHHSIAKDYGVSRPTISCIWRGETWGWLFD